MYVGGILMMLFGFFGAALAEGLPPLADAPVDDAARQRASALNTEGFKAWKAGRHVTAGRQYREAVLADPSFHLARYNLACVWAHLGKADDALAVLAAFKARGCKECLERLARSTTDEDWKSLWADPRFEALTGPGIDLSNVGPLPNVDRRPGPKPAAPRGVTQVTPEQVAAAVEAAFLRGEFAGLAAHLPNHMIRHVEVCTVCEAPDDRKIMKLAADGLEGVLRRMQAEAKGEDAVFLNGFEKMTCDGACCRSQRDQIMHNNIYLDGICTEPTEDGRRVITEIKFSFG